MRKITLLFLVLLLAGAVFAQQQSASPVIAVRLTTATPTVKAGSPIKVRLTLTNQSNTRISFNQSAQTNYRFDVSDDRGAVPRRPRQGDYDWRSNPLLGAEVRPMGGLGIATLEGGASGEEEIYISDLFSFGRPGTYRIRAFHPDPVSNEPVSSNPITITIVP